MPTGRNTDASGASGAFALGDSASALNEPGRSATGRPTADLCAALRDLQAASRNVADIIEDQLDVSGGLSDIGCMDMGGHTGTEADMGSSSAPSDYLAASDVAALLSVTARSVRRWRSDGAMPPAVVLGGVIRWSRTDIDAWLLSRKEGA